MARLVTIFTAQWADLDFETMCRKAQEMGYEGLEIACWGNQLDPERAAKDDAYVEEIKATLAKYGLQCQALGYQQPFSIQGGGGWAWSGKTG